MAIDPLQSEAEWLPGGLQVTLDSAKWQGINFLDTGNPFYVKEGELIGFTLSNDSYFTTGNTMMQVFSRNASVFDSSMIIQPYHSMKFYAKQYSTASPVGWQIRSFDWGMYIIMDCTTDGPVLVYQFRNDAISESHTTRKISAIIKGMARPAEPAQIKDVVLKYKIGATPYYESLPMTASADTFTALISGVSGGEKMRLYVAVVDSSGRRFQSDLQSYTITNVATHANEPPDQFQILQNYPNPFNPSTNISYSVPELTNVRIVVFDQLGREIQTLVDRKLQAGVYDVRFDGDGLASGLYFYRIQAGNFNQTKKMLLLR